MHPLSQSWRSWLRWLKICSKFSCMRDFSQALLFAEHVAGLGTKGYLMNPSVKGLVRESYFHREESRALSAKEVMALESVLIGGACYEIDCYFAGIILFVLYSGARVLDVRGISWSCVDKSDSAERVGLLRCGPLITRDPEDPGQVEFRSSCWRRPLVCGLCFYSCCKQVWLWLFKRIRRSDSSNSWFDWTVHRTVHKNRWCHEDDQRFDQEHSWQRRPWVNSIKATLLTWCAKYGMSEDDRHVLRGHSISSKKTMFGYSVISSVHLSEGWRAWLMPSEKASSGLIPPGVGWSGVWRSNLVSRIWTQRIKCHVPHPHQLLSGDVIKIDDDWVEVKDEGSPFHLVNDNIEVIGDESGSDSSSSSDSSEQWFGWHW